MIIKYLRKLRIIISILVLSFSLFVFCDFSETIPENLSKTFFSLQVVPSIFGALQFVYFSIFSIIVILVFTFLFGRIYCSTLCPLGILQDVVSRFARFFHKKNKKRFSFAKSKSVVRYTILTISILLLIFGFNSFVLLLDPYSNFGRIAITLFRPLYIFSNNVLAFIFNWFDIYTFYHLKIHFAKIGVFISTLTFFLIIIWLSATKGRFFCTTICPVGTLLGLFSRKAIFKLQINQNVCSSCSRCAQVCKAECIDYKSKQIDFERCVACFNCIESCNLKGISYKLNFTGKHKQNIETTDVSKRKFLFQSIAYIVGASVISNKILSQEKSKENAISTVAKTKNNVAMPPGAVDKLHFHSLCTACLLCVSSCPTNVLQASFLEYGFTDMLKPFMDFSSGFCNYQCSKCLQVCPTNALRSLSQETKMLTQIGVAKFVKENCIVFTNHTDCGACSEHCPTKAVHMVPHADIFIPQVNESICIGCGACEYICPVLPYKAIYVEGSTIQRLAEKPKVEKVKDKTAEDDFPF